jgi:heptosyltransferase-2
MKVLIELPTWLGDSVMTTPAISNIVNEFCDIEITLVGSPVSVESLKNNPNVVKSFVLNKTFTSLFKVVKNLDEYDFFISFRGSLRSTFFKFFISAGKKFNFNKRKYSSGHQVEKYNNFINDSLGLKAIAGKLHLHNVSKMPFKNNNKLLGINPGATYGSSKRWYPKEFAKVAIELSSEYDIVIFGGPQEIDIANDIENYLILSGVNNFQNLSGKTKINELISKISILDLLVTGDSGPMHIAAAFQVPTVAVFGPTEVSDTCQWMNSKSSIVKKELDCQPCMKRKCPLGHHNCMALIKAKDVIESIKLIS